MKYYEELIERIILVIEERLYVHVDYEEGVEGYELTLSPLTNDDFKSSFKVHYRDLERNEAVLSVTQNVVASFISDYKDSIYRPN